MSSNSLRSWLLLILPLAVASVLAGCLFNSTDNGGGGGGGGGPTGGRGSAPAPTLVNLADAAPDRVLALSLHITDIKLNDNSGGSFSVLNNASGLTVEMTHRAALNVPINLSLTQVPIGTYSGVTITLSSAATVTFVDDLGVTRQDLAPTVNPTTVTVSLASPLTIGTGTAVMLGVVFQPSSVAIDTLTNKATITPTFVAALVPAPNPSNTQTEANGRVRVFVGTVVATPGLGSTTFQLSSSQLANPITLTTDSGTAYSGDISAFGGIAGSNILQVQSELQVNGGMLVKQLDGENAGGGLTSGGDIEGAVTAVVLDVAAPFNVDSITMRVQDSATTGTVPALGSVVTINDFSAPTVFQVDTQDVDLTNLSFTPVFDRIHLRPTQTVSAIYSAVGTTTAPKKLKLRLQTLAGTVQATSAGSVVNQTLISFTPPADSIFVLLTGKTSLTVVQQPTTNTTLATPSPGNPLHVRGLLFFDTVSGNYFLIADQFTP